MKNSTFQKKGFPLAFLLLALTFITCCKDKPDEPSDPVLPPLTNEGKNTFGCYIDGEPFVAKVEYTLSGPVAVSGSFNESTMLLKIQGTREDDNDHLDKVSFRVYASYGVETYEMDIPGDEYYGYIDFSGEYCEYYHNLNNKGSVSITYLDIDKNIISGTFEMTLINNDCTKKTMVITDGRFDFGY